MQYKTAPSSQWPVMEIFVIVGDCHDKSKECQMYIYDSTLFLSLACCYLPYCHGMNYMRVKCENCFVTYQMWVIVAIFQDKPLKNENGFPGIPDLHTDHYNVK